MKSNGAAGSGWPEGGDGMENVIFERQIEEMWNLIR
jgi:hypothetical protein